MDWLTALYITTCAGAFAFSIKEEKKEKLMQSEENLSLGTSRAGLQGTGKTCSAIIDSIDLLPRGLKFAWITTQGERQSQLIDYIPKENLGEVELFAPYKPDSKGFNILKCYTDTENERLLRSQTIIIMVDSMTGGLVEVQRYCLKLASMAILEFQHHTKNSCTLHDINMFIKREDYRNYILDTLNRVDWKEDWSRISEETIKAVIRRLDDIMSYSILKRALCYTREDALDFRDMFDKILVCDFPEDNIHGCGTLQAIGLAQAMITQINILASTRRKDSPYYQIDCDEFYRYASGLEQIFRDFPDLHRQRRLALYLIWQRVSQMSTETLKIALSCGNRWFMQLEPEDDKKITDNPAYKDFKGKFANLKNREYIGFVKMGDKTTPVRGRTKDLPEPNHNNYQYVWDRCRSRLPKEDFIWWFDNINADTERVIDLEKFGVKASGKK